MPSSSSIFSCSQAVADLKFLVLLVHKTIDDARPDERMQARRNGNERRRSRRGGRASRSRGRRQKRRKRRRSTRVRDYDDGGQVGLKKAREGDHDLLPEVCPTDAAFLLIKCSKPHGKCRRKMLNENGGSRGEEDGGRRRENGGRGGIN